MIIVLCLTSIFICSFICTKLLQLRVIMISYLIILHILKLLKSYQYTLSIRQLCYGDRCDNEHSVKIEYPLSRPSSSNDTFSLMVSPVSAPSPLYNQFCRIVSEYLMIVDSSKKLSVFDSSNVKTISGQKKTKLIINSNDSFKNQIKITLKRAREDGMTKIILIVEEWDITVDDDYVNSFDSNINDVI